MKTNVHVLNGEIIHVGDWVFQYKVEPRPEAAPIIRTDMPPLNPVPEGTIEVETEIAWATDGRVVFADSTDAVYVDNEMKVRIN